VRDKEFRDIGIHLSTSAFLNGRLLFQWFPDPFPLAYCISSPITLTMLGTFQQSSLRIEIAASEQSLKESLTSPAKLQQWLAPIRLDRGLPEQLQPGLTYISWAGPVPIQHQVDRVESNCLRVLLSKGVDGFQEWYWGDGWVQSRLEGISLLPLNLGQTLSLLRLRQFLARQNEVQQR